MKNKSLYVPSLDTVGHYIEPTFAGNIKLTQMLDFALENKMNVLLEGDAGTGKTMGFMYWCALRGLPFVSVPSNSAFDFTTQIGGFYPDENGKLQYVDGSITQVVRNGGMLLINELNNAHKSLSQYLMSLGDDRRAITLLSHDNEVIHAHKDFILVADQNPNYRYTQPLNEAWKDRFQIKLNLGYNRAIESQIIKSPALLDLAYGQRSTTRVESHASTSSTIFETPVSTRMLKTFEKLANGLNYDFACDVYINNFTDEEKPAVKMLLEGASYNIKEELGITQDAITTEHDND